ncbi:MAG: cytochrome C [Gemmatimonadota bacterium]
MDRLLTKAELLLALGIAISAAACTSSDQAPTRQAGEVMTTTPERAATLGCVSCHEGIENIREEGSGMLATIKAFGTGVGDPEGCVVCHGGNPLATSSDEAHQGVPDGISPSGPTEFYPDPGSIWVADRTCGQCHPGYADRLAKALMNTEAGKIQGNLHTWGVAEVQDYQVPWGNYDIADEDGREPSVGTDAYKAYMNAMMAAWPDQFPDQLAMIPDPSVEEIVDDPKLAGFTYQRQQCQRCHVGVKGRERRGDYRGMGCSSCHVLYGNEGIYEGNDPTVDKSEVGHMLSHRIVGTRKAGRGIPVETCNSCHNRGKRIGVTYQGLMEFPYGSPYDGEGNKQEPLHTKQYLFISDDLHHQQESREGNPSGGMLCQDCHTTIDMHGDGNIAGTTLAQVEIECADCHGTPDSYPWELPLGFGEEFGKALTGSPRGLAEQVLRETAGFATAYDARDGHLLTARGNPFGNVVRDGDDVILHSASGTDFNVPVLKQISLDGAWQSEEAQVAMVEVESHADRLECYACHASWVPQCYGCHVQVNYGVDAEGKAYTDVDWVASGNEHTTDGQTAESTLGLAGLKSPGKVFESRSYLRWEDPVLGINGEGRVTPLMPGCQVVFTVIGPDGETVTLNQIARVEDEAAAAGQQHVPLGIDMAPVQPHSAQRKARTCESCHNNPKALGYGISGGVFQTRYSQPIVEDLVDAATGEPIPENFRVQIQSIPNLDFDWSTIVNRETGDQVATVGTHWPLSRALNAEERSRLERTGLCMGCHREMRNRDLWSSISTPGRLDNDAHIELMNRLLQAEAGGGRQNQ